MEKTYRTILWIFIAIIILSILNMIHSVNIHELQNEINQLKFEKEYIEYVKEDSERQRNWWR